MQQTKTMVDIAIELPPQGGFLSPVSTLEEDAHFLIVNLEKSENFKVVIGVRLRDMLKQKFNGNRNLLRDWYEETVVQGKAHRAWSTVEGYLGTVREHGELAANAFANQLVQRKKTRKAKHGGTPGTPKINDNEINDVLAKTQPIRQPPSEYDQRKVWLSDMNHLWFKANIEWQNRWLQEHNLRRG